jgi:hypothetical protein
MSDRSKHHDPYEYATVDSPGRRRELERPGPIVPWPGAWLETKAKSGGASMEA